MPRLLKDLRIDDVSSVDVGAGRGVRVMLMKREEPVSKPWASNDQLPAQVQGLPDHAKTVFRRVANDRMKAGDSEVSAIRQAWTAVKNGWKKEGDQWVRKAEDDDVATKREFSTEERDSAADRGQALPDGSFPIKNKSDLSNAIQAVGRAKNRARAIAHIKTRARALGASDMIPENWSKRAPSLSEVTLASAALQECIKSVMSDVEINDKDAAIEKLFTEYESYLAGDPAEPELTAMTLEQLSKAYDEALAKEMTKWSDGQKAFYEKLTGDNKRSFAGMSPADRDKYMKDHPLKMGKPMQKDDKTEKAGGGDHDAGSRHGKPVDDQIEDDTDTKEGDSPEPAAQHRTSTATSKRLEEITKAHDVVKAENADLKKRLGALEEIQARADFAKRARDIGLTEAQGEMLLKAHRGDPEALKQMEATIKALNEQTKQSDVFKEFGTRHESNGGATAYDQLVAKASEIRKVDPKLTAEQAFDKAISDPANRELVVLEKQERDRRISRVSA